MELSKEFYESRFPEPCVEIWKLFTIFVSPGLCTGKLFRAEKWEVRTLNFCLFRLLRQPRQRTETFSVQGILGPLPLDKKGKSSILSKTLGKPQSQWGRPGREWFSSVISSCLLLYLLPELIWGMGQITLVGPTLFFWSTSSPILPAPNIFKTISQTFRAVWLCLVLLGSQKMSGRVDLEYCNVQRP